MRESTRVAIGGGCFLLVILGVLGLVGSLILFTPDYRKSQIRTAFRQSRMHVTAEFVTGPGELFYGVVPELNTREWWMYDLATNMLEQFEEAGYKPMPKDMVALAVKEMKLPVCQAPGLVAELLDRKKEEFLCVVPEGGHCVAAPCIDPVISRYLVVRADVQPLKK